MLTNEELKNEINKPIIEKISKVINKAVKQNKSYHSIKDIIDKALEINGINKNEITKAIIDTENISYIYKFYKETKLISDEEIYKLVSNANDMKYIMQLTIDINNKEIKDKLVNILLKSDDARYICEYAIKEKNIDVNRFAKRLIEIKNPVYIYSFAEIIKNAPYNELAKGIIASNNTQYITLFTDKFQDKLDKKTINNLKEKMITIGEPQEIFEFVKKIHNSDIEILEDKIIELDNSLYRIKYAKEIENSDKNKLLDIKDFAKNNLMKGKIEDKKELLNYLLRNTDFNDEEDSLFLKVYYEFLNNNHLITIDEASKLDEEYNNNYINKKTKIRKI